jgi:pimeloyl-ACP methyl ester carboxylesterase
MNGRNMGPGNNVLDRLLREVEFKVEHTGDKVTLIGHSLGGVYAREIARSKPELVEQVISLASPFNISFDRTSVVRKIYSLLNDVRTEESFRQRIEAAPPVPTTAVFTRSDAVIDWKYARQKPSHSKTENIEVYGSHCGLTLNASVWYLLKDRLSQSVDNWQKFDNSGWRKQVYPVANLTSP